MDPEKNVLLHIIYLRYEVILKNFMNLTSIRLCCILILSNHKTHETEYIYANFIRHTNGVETRGCTVNKLFSIVLVKIIRNIEFNLNETSQQNTTLCSLCITCQFDDGSNRLEM